MSEKLSGDALRGVEGWLKERTGGRCPFCEGARWSIDDELCTLPALQRSTPPVQLERGYAMVLITCEECGYSAPFSAKRLGLVP